MSVYLPIGAFLAFRLFRNFYFHIAVTVPFFMGHGLTLTQIFALESIYYVFKVLGDIPAGAFADSYSKRMSVAFSGFVGAAGYLLMASSDTVIGFGIAQAMLGLAVALFSGADSTAILSVLQKAGKTKLYGLVESSGWAARNLGFGTAAIAGGFVAATYGAGITWFLTAISVLISGFLILLLPDDRDKDQAAARRSTVTVLKEVTIFMRQDLFVFGVLAYFATVFSLVRIGLWFLQPMANELGLDVSMNGVLFSGTIIISVVFGSLSGALFSTDRIKPSLIFVSAAGILFPLFWSVSLGANQTMGVWTAFLIGFFLFGILQGLYDPVAKIWVASRIPPEIRTTVLSTGSLVANLAFACIGPLGGYLGDRFGIAIALALLSILHAIPLCVASIALLKVRSI